MNVKYAVLVFLFIFCFHADLTKYFLAYIDKLVYISVKT